MAEQVSVDFTVHNVELKIVEKPGYYLRQEVCFSSISVPTQRRKNTAPTSSKPKDTPRTENSP